MRRLVDVNEMKIAIAVAEFRGAGGAFLRRERSLVTAKTKIVIGNEKGSVKARWVFVGCQSVIRGAMWIVTCGAIPVLDRAVRIWICRQEFLHVGEFLFLTLDRLVVALQTDIEPVRKEQSAFLRRVRVMAVHAGSLFRNRGMMDRRRLQLAGDILMAFAT